MSTVTKPIALNESFNTTDQTPKNIADVMKKGMQEIAQAIESHQGGGGHVIVDQNGNALDQEPNMTFLDAHLSDNSTDESTDIELIQSVSESDWESATEDGLYDVDIEGAEIGPASDEYVEVEADGEKTYEQLLNELYTKIDTTKLNNNNTKLSFGGIIYNPILLQGGNYYFSRSGVENSLPAIFEVGVLPSSSYYTFYQNNTYTDRSSTSPTRGVKLTLYYGNKYSVIDLQTTANRCLTSNGSTVEKELFYDDGDTISLTNTYDCMYGYVNNTSTIRLFLALQKPIKPDATHIHITIPTSFGIATVNGSKSLSGCSISKVTKTVFGLALQITCDSNSSLVDTTPIMCGINATISIYA